MRKSVLFIFLVVLASRLVFISSSPNKVDSAGYLVEIKSFVENGSFPEPKTLQYEKVFFTAMSVTGGKLFSVLGFKDYPELSLLTLSVLFGTLSIVVFFLLSQLIFENRSRSFWGTIIFAVTPLIWWLSEEMLTDGVNLFFVLTGLYLLFSSYRKKRKYALVLGCLVLGLSLLVRFTNIWLVPVFLVFLFGQKLKLPEKLIAFGLFLFPIFFYLCTSLILFSNLTIGYFFATDNFLFLVKKWVFSPGRWFKLFTMFESGVTLPMIALAVSGLVGLLKKRQIFISLVLFSWFAPFAIYSRMIPETSLQIRHFAFIAPPLILLSIYGLKLISSFFPRRNLAFLFLSLALTVFLSGETIPILILDKNKSQYEVVESKWLCNNALTDDLILSGHEYPFLTYYCPDKNIAYSSYDPKARQKIITTIARGGKVYFSKPNVGEVINEALFKDFTLNEVFVIPGSKIRNQLDFELRELSFTKMAKSWDNPIISFPQ